LSAIKVNLGCEDRKNKEEMYFCMQNRYCVEKHGLETYADELAV
jgi:hypothetical protein